MMFKQPIKEYFSFTASERNAILIIIFLLLLLIFSGVFEPKKSNKNLESLEIALLEFNDKKQQEEKKEINFSSGILEENLAMFNPNNLTDSQWLNIGLKNYQIENIRNYIDKIGNFQSKEDFQSLYTLSESEYQKLAPYLMFENKQASASNVTSATEEVNIQKYIEKPARKKIRRIELNTADANELELLPGIGPVYSKRIKKYQELLGGYVDVNQLYEVYGLDSVILEKIAPHIWIDTSVVEKLNINLADEQELFRHPYINKYEAKSLVTFRQYKNIDSLEELLNENILSVETYSKIRPYLK